MPAGIVPTLTSENWRKRARTLHIFGAEIPSVFRRFRWTKKTLRASWFFALHSKQKIDFTWPKDVGRTDTECTLHPYTPILHPVPTRWSGSFKWDKVLKNAFCLNRPYPFKFFKSCLPQILFGPFLNTLFQMILHKHLIVNGIKTYSK